MTVLRVAVVSDIHADAALDEPRDSYVRTEPPKRLALSNPLRDLVDFVDQTRLRADILLCPGDMTNRSDDVGKIYAWRTLNELADALGAQHLYASPGNHDLETHSASPDPASTLKNLNPSYPTREVDRDADFWRLGYCIIEEALHRLIILDSCKDFPSHPNTDDPAAMAEYVQKLDRGSFGENTQISLEQALADMTYRPVNILLTHHHVIEHEKRNLFKDTYGPMHRGDELVEILDRYDNAGRWLVIHGHKHVPLLVNAAGNSAGTPIVLSAASLGGKLWHPIVTVTRNQFHMLEFHTDTVPGLPDLRGVCHSFMWGFGTGWSVSSDVQAGLPAACGFGITHDHRDLARRVDSNMTASGSEISDWADVVAAIPELTYQGPRDFNLFERRLEELRLQVVRDRNGRRRRVVRVDDDD